MSEPKAVRCPLCGKPALEREFTFAGSPVSVVECPCVPPNRPQWLDRLGSYRFARNPGKSS